MSASSVRSAAGPILAAGTGRAPRQRAPTEGARRGSSLRDEDRRGEAARDGVLAVAGTDADGPAEGGERGHRDGAAGHEGELDQVAQQLRVAAGNARDRRLLAGLQVEQAA